MPDTKVCLCYPGEECQWCDMRGANWSPRTDDELLEKLEANECKDLLQKWGCLTDNVLWENDCVMLSKVLDSVRYDERAQDIELTYWTCGGTQVKGTLAQLMLDRFWFKGRKLIPARRRIKLLIQPVLIDLPAGLSDATDEQLENWLKDGMCSLTEGAEFSWKEVTPVRNPHARQLEATNGHA